MMALPDLEQRTLVCCSPHQWEALYPPPNGDNDDDDDDDDDDDYDDDDDDDEVVDDNDKRQLVTYIPHYDRDLQSIAVF